MGTGSVRERRRGGAGQAAGLCALAASLVLLGTAAAPVDEPCKLAKGTSPLARACAEGGIPRAKQIMKEMVQKGRKAGVKLECDQCHKEPGKYEVLTDDAREKLRKLQQAIDSDKKSSTP